MQSYRHCPVINKDKKKKSIKKSEVWVKFFAKGCVFYRAGDWDDLQIGLYVSLHVGFKIQFAGIVPVFLEFNGLHGLCLQRKMSFVFQCLTCHSSKKFYMREKTAFSPKFPSCNPRALHPCGRFIDHTNE